jgi:putative transcriptional regulator
VKTLRADFSRRRFALTLLALDLAFCVQDLSAQEPGIGKLLVARRDAPDPVFGKTVILLVRYQRDGTLGLVINRPTDVPVARALRGVKGAERRDEPVYAGGPVAPGTALALLRANVMPEEGVAHVQGKVYTITNKPFLEKTLESKAGPAELRVFLGYSGWAKGQLESEIESGFWHVLPADASLAFDEEPETLWTRLVARAEQRIARVFFPAFPGKRR